MIDFFLRNPGVMMAAVGGAVFVFVALIGAMILMSRSRRSVEDRLSRVQAGSGKRKKLDMAKKATEMRLRKTESRSDVIAKSFVPNPGKMREELERTGTGISLGTYFLGSVLAGLVCYIIFQGLAGLGLMASIAVSIAGGIVLPPLFVKRTVAKRKRLFLKQLPDALDLMVRGIKAGLPVTESFQLVASEMDKPIADEFSRMADAIRLGQDVETSLWDTEKRIQLAEWRFFITSLSIQRETGGNLAETLSNLSDVLRKRQQIKLKVKAYSSEARAGAWILGALPFVMFGIIFAVNRPYVQALFTDPRGMFLIGAAGLSLLIGIFVMAKMIRFEV